MIMLPKPRDVQIVVQTIILVYDWAAKLIKSKINKEKKNDTTNTKNKKNTKAGSKVPG